MNQTRAPFQSRDSDFLRMCLSEREEIQRHKWFESEKAGHDIGYDRALLSWVRRHQHSWWNENTTNGEREETA